MAFNAMVNKVRKDLIDMDALKDKTNKERLEHAFALADRELGIPMLIDPEGKITLSCSCNLLSILFLILGILLYSMRTNPTHFTCSQLSICLTKNIFARLKRVRFEPANNITNRLLFTTYTSIIMSKELSNIIVCFCVLSHHDLLFMTCLFLDNTIRFDRLYNAHSLVCAASSAEPMSFLN